MAKSSELQQHDTQRDNQNFKTRVNNAYKLYKSTDNLAPLLQLYAEYTTDENDKTPLHFFIKKTSVKLQSFVYFGSNSEYQDNPESVLISEIDNLYLVILQRQLKTRKLPDENSPEYKDIKLIKTLLLTILNFQVMLILFENILQSPIDDTDIKETKNSIKYEDTAEYKKDNALLIMAAQMELTKPDDSKQLSIEDTNNTDTKTTLSIADNSDSIEKTDSEILGQQLNEDPAQ